MPDNPAFVLDYFPYKHSFRLELRGYNAFSSHFKHIVNITVAKSDLKLFLLG